MLEEINSFNDVRTLDEVRTRFRIPHSVKTTGNTGRLIPFFAKEILPKDDITMYMKSLVKMTTPITQTMDNIFLDVFWFFIPRRQVWEHWKNFMGEKTTTAYEEEPEYTIPVTKAPSGGWTEDTIADYLGMATKVGGTAEMDSAYLRAYVHIVNEWFRDQQRQPLANFRIDDANETGSNGDNYVTDLIKGGMPFRAAKIHDYFTSSLLTPTGRESVLLPLGDYANVIGNGKTLGFSNNMGLLTGNVDGVDGVVQMRGNAFGTNINTNVGYDGTKPNGGYSIGITTDPEKSGLVADLSTAVAATVNQLRKAFQLQKIFERNNIAGHRYMEQLKNRWNVVPDDLTLQRPEYLGGKRIPLNIDLIVQTGATNEVTPLGNMGGFSTTQDEELYFSKGFKEHGILMGLCVVRHNRTYQQGIPKKFSRKNMEDFYTPEFQNLGEVGIKNKEIFAQGTVADEEIFGYQEYGAEYRFEPNVVTGRFRSNATNNFDNWHYADDYEALPVNNAEWIAENEDSVNRTLTVTSDTADQFYFDFYMEETNVRSLPPHSMPGFIDHH